MALLFVAVGAATLGILVVMGISLVRQLRRLSGALQEFSAAITPAVQDIQREGDRAQVLAEGIERRRREREQEREEIPSGRPGRGRRKR
jgi:F0F1-type ATP synthase membrane subunit b/b'